MLDGLMGYTLRNTWEEVREAELDKKRSQNATW